MNHGGGGKRRRLRGGVVEADGQELFVMSIPSMLERLPAKLTTAERAVAALVLEGLSNREVATLRGTSVRTIANQVGSLFRKLGVNDRTELVGLLLVRTR
jgi:DNA-binding NarL/FixJ family response regulator